MRARTAIAIGTVATVVATAGSAMALVPAEQAPVADAGGVGEIRIGSTLGSLRAEKLVGGARMGCELARGERVAPLRPPLEGVAHFYPGERLSAINITGGAVTSTGVRIGSPAGRARRAYPGAIYDSPPAHIPTLPGYLWIGGRFHSRMALVIGNGSRRVLEITIPHPSICE